MQPPNLSQFKKQGGYNMRRQIIKDVALTVFAFILAFIGIWVAYFATF